MKKSILLLTLPLLFLTAPTLQAQNTPTSTDDVNKNEISFNVGAFPAIGFFYQSGIMFGPVQMPFSMPPLWSYYLYRDEDYHSALIGSFSLSYKYNFNKFHTIGVAATWACRTTGFVSDDKMIHGTDHYLALQLGYKITYKRYNNISLYSALYAGTTLYFEDDVFFNYMKERETSYSNLKGTCWIAPNFHITLVGISLGKKNAANIELGFGTQGILNFGYAYKF